MRYLIVSLAFLLSTFATAFGQEIVQSQVQSQIPQATLTSFSEDFSNAGDVEWEMRPNNHYEVEFDTRWDRDHEAWYDEKGTMLYHKEEIPNKEIPAKIVDIAQTEFKDHRIDDADKITENDKVRYLLALDADNSHDIDLLIQEDGEIISQNYDD
jgi:hypothetical protein